MSKDDINQYIEGVARGLRPANIPDESGIVCGNCGAPLDEETGYVSWSVEATPGTDVDGGTEFFCDEACEGAYKEELLGSYELGDSDTADEVRDDE